MAEAGRAVNCTKSLAVFKLHMSLHLQNFNAILKCKNYHSSGGVRVIVQVARWPVREAASMEFVG